MTYVTTIPPVTFPYRVTREQLDRCQRFFDEQAGRAFYLVESESQPDTEYRVEWRDGWTCECKSGAINFANVKHPSGVCKHVRWSACREIEYRYHLRVQAENEARAFQSQLPFEEPPTYTTSYHNGTREHLLNVNGQEADDATYQRVMNAQPPQPTEAEIEYDQHRYQFNKPFSIL
jgi:hypothetical protein